MAETPESAVDLTCDRCGYDLRAQPDDGKCPECGAAVAESRRLAAIPRRPAWRESDPRWRRRVLAGVWVLALLPLMDALRTFGWASSVPVPNVFDSRGAVRTLDETLLGYRGVYEPLIFCIGVVLLFTRERGRRPGPLDWTRRWGVVCSYVVLLLSATHLLFVGALVMAGVAALFQSMPLQNQPRVTQPFVEVSTVYLRYGAQSNDASAVALVAFSSIAILLACVPLFDALRSGGPKPLAATLVAPLALFALMHLAQVGRHCVGFSRLSPDDLDRYGVYFSPEVIARSLARLHAGLGVWGSGLGTVLVEAAKWCVVLSVALWLTVARLAAWRQGRKPSAA